MSVIKIIDGKTGKELECKYPYRYGNFNCPKCSTENGVHWHVPAYSWRGDVVQFCKNKKCKEKFTFNKNVLYFEGNEKVSDKN